MEGPYLDLAPDPSLWLVGPTPDRPYDAWLPGAIEATLQAFELRTEETRQREYVEEMLRAIGEFESPTLPYFWVHWAALEEPPGLLFVGQVARDGGFEWAPGEQPDLEILDSGDLAELWLAGADTVPVERPIREELEAPAAMKLSRSVVYAHDLVRNLVHVSVRYVVDTGHPRAVVLAQSMGTAPRNVLANLDDYEDLLRTVWLTDRTVNR